MPSGETHEYYYFTIDDWTRQYGFGLNPRRWEMAPDHYYERDCTFVAGRLRSTCRRRIDYGEARILPSLVARDRWGDAADLIGNVWIKSGRLYCSAFVPSDAYYSLQNALASSLFEEMEWRVVHTQRAKGKLLRIDLNSFPSEVDRERQAFKTADAARVSGTH